jgi:hypothetical protein
MLEYLSAETGKIIAFPGGNSAITARLQDHLKRDLKPRSVRAGCITVKVRYTHDSVLVTYADPAGKLHTLRAKTCLFAAPKFIARKVIEGIPVDQEKAMQDIQYRGYVVGNVILNRSIPSPSFELYCLEGKMPPSPTAMNPSPRPFTDICFATWAKEDKTEHSVLTVYKPFAFDGDRQFLFNPAAHDKYKTRIFDGIQPILKALQLDEKNIQGIRMTRWGHSVPTASPGCVANGNLARSHRTIANRIFFANQDNWADPSFESSVLAADAAANEISKILHKQRT